MNKLRTVSRYFINAVLCAVLLTTGCNKPKSGKVTWIGFVPPHNERVMEMGYGGNGVTYVWVDRYVPDTTWYIKFSNGKKEREICVSREDAYKYSVGDGIELTDD